MVQLGHTYAIRPEIVTPIKQVTIEKLFRELYGKGWMNIESEESRDYQLMLSNNKDIPWDDDVYVAMDQDNNKVLVHEKMLVI